MVVRGILSPPRTKFSSSRNNSNNAASKPNELSKNLREETKPTTIRPTKNNNGNGRSSNNNTSRINPSKSTSKLVSSRPKTATSNPNGQKKLDKNSTTKIISKPSSPRTPKPVTHQTRPTPNSKRNVKNRIASCSGSRSELSSAGKNKYFHSRNGSPNDLGSNHRYSAGHYATLHDLHVSDQLQRLSIDGKDLAGMVLHPNSIYESMGSDTKEASSSQSNDSRMFQIYKEIAFHRQENSSITSYFTKLEALWDELATFKTDLLQCSCGGATEKLSEYMEREKVMQFLVGLNDSYSKICNQILLSTPFPTMEKAYSAVIREEKHRELVVELESVAGKVIQNNWLDLQNQNAHSSNNGDNNDGVQQLVDHSNDLHEQQFDQILW
ncbi:hybrid signal transduction histidine kinase L-like isoform X2 [Benincasa hispida]|uniref:hybrid signal transduction histidine kinase L-like isoform X2 n=1 Tax=Benincasa hispida TaxID=102211 RepID=UPI0019029D37|nr:hybrid signal transduction histidine kinase L-like isoform X2 [Benincasa hispida]